MTPLPTDLLPEPVETMNWRHMRAFRHDQNGAFFLTALRYGRQLWNEQLPARALLAVDRALYADLRGDEPELATHPLPYAVIAWMVKNNPDDAFTGNARVHYQHLADRVRGEREEQKRWRAWAAWALVRRVRPELPADPKHAVEEPSEARIEKELTAHGIPGETAMWRAALAAYPAA